MDKAREYIVKALDYYAEVLDEDHDGFIVMIDDDDHIIFSEIQKHNGFPKEEVEVQHSRFEFERASCSWLIDNLDKVKDARIMFGIAQLWVLTSDRGMLRHVIDWTNSEHIKCAWNIIHVEDGE